ncbi:TPR-like protein [Anaeromyces robustus]|uniref:TPR-like protein n=1 Tax=Anaeromyces robustus TaxID=1754192 RepID=A0A1Y1X8W2_9FUNG|nr:TPR-like protein [Anaeromyces robustus]|eukprot:ORX81794.1 TPR-like protein [Anaeromyces robustus]
MEEKKVDAGTIDQPKSEYDRLWEAVSKDPNDFKSWEELIAVAENVEGGITPNIKPEDVEKIHRVYENFLYKFPLCFGYWKKYSDIEMIIGGVEKAEEVFEKGVNAIHNSIDLWIQYCDFKIQHCKDNEKIRDLFERGAQNVGLDFQSQPFWEKYVEWEETNHEEAKAFAILERVIKIPLHAYTVLFEKYSNLSVTRPITELVPSDKLKEVEEIVDKSLEGKDDKSNREQLIRQEIHKIKSEQYMKVQSEVQKRWEFEMEIKRPYFHVKPLDQFQLKNWRKYLDFEESQGDFYRIYTLYERCLVSCALYEEFWERYAKYLASKGNIQDAVNVFLKAINVFIPPNYPHIRLAFAIFQEEQGNIKEARELYQQTMATVSGHIETIEYYYNFERRQNNIQDAENILTSSLNEATEDNIKIYLTVKLAQFYEKHKQDVDAARKLFKDSIEKFLTNKFFLYNYLQFELRQKDIDSVQENCKELFTIIKSEQCTLSMNEKIVLGKLFYEFLMDRGTSVSLFREIGDDIKKMEQSDKNTTTNNTTGRKRQLTENTAYEQQQKRVATQPMVTPTATMTPQTQAYPSTGYYGDMSAASYQYNPQAAQAYQQNYYGGWDYSQQQQTYQ